MCVHRQGFLALIVRDRQEALSLSVHRHARLNEAFKLLPQPQITWGGFGMAVRRWEAFDRVCAPFAGKISPGLGPHPKDGFSMVFGTTQTQGPPSFSFLQEEAEQANVFPIHERTGALDKNKEERVIRRRKQNSRSFCATGVCQYCSRPSVRTVREQLFLRVWSIFRQHSGHQRWKTHSAR